MSQAILTVEEEYAVLEGDGEAERLESDAVVSLDEWV